MPTLDDEVNEIRLGTAEIVNSQRPAERGQAVGLDGGQRRAATNDASGRRRSELRQDSPGDSVKKSAKLWAPHLPPEFGGMGLSFMQHAYMNEVLAYSPGAASLFGVVAPNSGNQKILVKYGTPEQHEKWLKPLTEGRCSRAFR